MRRAIEAMAEPHAYAGVGQFLTVSVGVATAYPTPDDNLAASVLLDSADQALYSAKNAGRNRVCVGLVKQTFAVA
jgi:PleD family two-component response regulator